MPWFNGGIAVFFQSIGLKKEIGHYLLQVSVLTLELLDLDSCGIPYRIACQPLLSRLHESRPAPVEGSLVQERRPELDEG